MLVVSLFSPNDTLRRAVPRQLREHQHHRRALSRARRRRGAHLRRRRLRDAHLGQAGPAAPSSGSRCRTSRARCSSRARSTPPGQVGGRARARRAGDDLHRPRAGPAADAGGVRRHRRALEPGRLGRAPEGRRADRARRAQLPADRPRQRPARRAASPSSRRPGSNALAVAEGVRSR